MKKHRTLTARLLSLLLALILLLALTPSVLAVEANAAEVPPGGQAEPLIDETEWFFRTVDGIAYMRLWSYTEGKWLTDWIEIGYV